MDNQYEHVVSGMVTGGPLLNVGNLADVTDASDQDSSFRDKLASVRKAVQHLGLQSDSAFADQFRNINDFSNK